MMINEPIRLLELFGGIGACSAAFKRLGIPYVIADYVEIDKYAVKSYNAMHGTHFEPQDITQWDKDIEVDFIMHGSPCQDFSIAGRGAGGDKGSGTRSSLMHETLRIVEKLCPKYVLWENVPNMLSDKHRHNFDAYWETMETLGYVNQSWKLNAKDYGIPQNRERVFTLSVRNDININLLSLKQHSLTKSILNILEEKVDSKYYIKNKNVEHLLNSFLYSNSTKLKDKQNHMNIIESNMNILFRIPQWRQRGNVYNPNGIIGCLAATDYKTPKLVLSDFKVRKLSPREYWRLMGFSDAQFNRAASVNSDTQLYKQAGNSIVVDVLMAILRELFSE